MNEILQKRIDEAAKRYSWSHDTIGVDKETFHTEASQKAPIPIHKEVRVPIYHEMEVAFKCAANFILNNQWISVEEALPERLENENVSDYVFVSNKNWVDVFRYDFKNNNWLDYVNNTHWGITHWMSIPSLEGGEE